MPPRSGSPRITASSSSRKRPSETDKSKLSYKPAHAVKVKKRYVIGRDLGTSPEAHHGSIDVTAGAEGGMEFWIPRGANRFHFTGGARFVHGGAMPQEVVVPLVTVTQLRGTEKAELAHREGLGAGARHQPQDHHPGLSLRADSDRGGE